MDNIKVFNGTRDLKLSIMGDKNSHVPKNIHKSH